MIDLKDSIAILLVSFYTGLIFGKMYILEQRTEFLEHQLINLENTII